MSDAATARALWQEHFRVYNQSLRALRAGAGFSFNTAEYWDFIRAGASDFLKPDPAVRPVVVNRHRSSVTLTQACQPLMGPEFQVPELIKQ